MKDDYKRYDVTTGQAMHFDNFEPLDLYIDSKHDNNERQEDIHTNRINAANAAALRADTESRGKDWYHDGEVF